MMRLETWSVSQRRMENALISFLTQPGIALRFGMLTAASRTWNAMLPEK